MITVSLIFNFQDISILQLTNHLDTVGSLWGILQKAEVREFKQWDKERQKKANEEYVFELVSSMRMKLSRVGPSGESF